MLSRTPTHKCIATAFAIIVLSLAGSASSQIDPAAERHLSALMRKLLDLPAPPPVKSMQPRGEEPDPRPAEFYSWKNLPPDDAPIEDLLAYWKHEYGDGNRIRYKVEPSAKVVERLLEHCRENPAKLVELLGNMPRTEQAVEGVKEIYDKMRSESPDSGGPQNQVRRWLTHNSKYFVDDLVRTARRVRDENNYVSNEHQAALKALARVDWDAARQHVDRLEMDASQPYSQTLAYWIRYTRALATDDASAAESYREKLKRIVENSSAPWAQRDLAMDALVDAGKWEGRDEWYTSLLSDETLLTIQENGYTGLTTMLIGAPPDEWRERMLKLVRSGDKAVRTAAARNLLKQGLDQEIVNALLPWVADPNWAKESRDSERGGLITALGDMDHPEAVPMLITALANEDEYTKAVAEALVGKKDARAVPALTAALERDNDGDTRGAIISALVKLGGIPDNNLLADLEAFLEATATDDGKQKFYELKYALDEYAAEEDEEGSEEPEVRKPKRIRERKKRDSVLPVELSIGEYVSELSEPSEGLATLAIRRETELRKASPEFAERLAEVMRKWKGRVVYLELIRRMRGGEADIDAVLDLLAERRDVFEKVPLEVANMRSSAGAFRGLAACIAAEEQEALSILANGHVESRIAALGCSRLTRLPLPVDAVARLLESANADLRLAAERYLEAEDSPAARSTLLTRKPGEALILGARHAFVPPQVTSHSAASLQRLFSSVAASPYVAARFARIEKQEENFKAEFRSTPGLQAVYAKLLEAEAGHMVIRVYKDRVTFTHYEDEARFREGELSEKEFKEFRAFVESSKIDEMGPEFQDCHHGCPSGQFIMLGRNGGRRNFYQAYAPPEGLKKLADYYETFAAKKLRLRYPLADAVRGIEVIHADAKLPAHAVVKEGEELRVLVSDPEMRDIRVSDIHKMVQEARAAAEESDDPSKMDGIYEMQRKMLEQSAGAEFSWRRLDDGKLGAETTKPGSFPFETKFAAALFGLSRGQNPYTMLGPSVFQALSGRNGIVVFSNFEGLNIARPGAAEPSLLKKGRYENPIASHDDRWILSAKAPPSEGHPPILVRVNSATGREHRVLIPEADSITPVAFLADRKRFLVYRGPRREPAGRESGDTPGTGEAEAIPSRNPSGKSAPRGPEYYLVDPVTGAFDRVRGDFRPLEAPSFRPLQPAGKAGDVWVALHDDPRAVTELGVYTISTFTFAPLLTLPKIKLSSSDVWVDEKSAKVYFVYNSHLLSVPLPQ